MAWGRKEAELPESLKGKTPEQVAQELADAAKLKADNETLKAKQTELETASSTQRSELQQMRERLATLEANPPKPREAGKEPTSVLVDEAAAFQEHLSPLALNQLATNARIEKMSFEQRVTGLDAKVLSTYRQEYEDLCKRVSVEQAAQPGTFDNVLAIIKGRHTEEILDMQKKGTGVFFTESSSHQPPPTDAKKSDQLSAEEQAMARKFGISEKDYAASRNAIPVMGV